MGRASIEVSGPRAEQIAGDLRETLAASEEAAVSVSAVEVERSAELVIAFISLVFSGVGAAKTLWDWWRPQASQGVTVRVVFDDGTGVDLSKIDQAQLEAELQRRAGSTGTAI